MLPHEKKIQPILHIISLEMENTDLNEQWTCFIFKGKMHGIQCQIYFVAIQSVAGSMQLTSICFWQHMLVA